MQRGQAVTGGLQRCCVLREQAPRHGLGLARYCMYLGAHNEKFLLAALQTSRLAFHLRLQSNVIAAHPHEAPAAGCMSMACCVSSDLAAEGHQDRSSVERILLRRLVCRREVTIHLDRQCRGRPIARLDCSVLQMRYRVAPTAGCALPFVHMLTRAEGLQKRPSLAGIPLPRMLDLSRSRSSPCPGEEEPIRRGYVVDNGRVHCCPAGSLASRPSGLVHHVHHSGL